MTTSFDPFYRLHRVYVQDLCRRRFAKQEDVMDLLSLVWMEVYRSFDRFDVHNAKALLYRLVQWRANDLYRKRYRTPTHKLELHLDEASLLHLIEQQQRSVSSPEDQFTLRQLLLAESPLDRQLLIGRYLEGLGWAELAAKHELHRNTIQKRVQATLARLRSHFLVQRGATTP